MKQIFQSAKVVILALALSIGISYVSAWTAPTATTPSSNVAAPINVSSTAQLKPGDLSVWNLISNGVVTNNAVVTNSIAGNTVATNNLVVATGAAAGKVLTSDALGNATWQAPASSGVTSLTAGSGITLSGSTGAVTVSSTGGVGTGLTGMLAPLKGKSISCWTNPGGGFGVYGYAQVDANGYPWVRARDYWGDTGWVQAFTYSKTFGPATLSAKFDWGGTEPTVSACTTDSYGCCTMHWPMT